MDLTWLIGSNRKRKLCVVAQQPPPPISSVHSHVKLLGSMCMISTCAYFKNFLGVSLSLISSCLIQQGCGFDRSVHHRLRFSEVYWGLWLFLEPYFHWIDIHVKHWSGKYLYWRQLAFFLDGTFPLQGSSSVFVFWPHSLHRSLLLFGYYWLLLLIIKIFLAFFRTSVFFYFCYYFIMYYFCLMFNVLHQFHKSTFIVPKN